MIFVENFYRFESKLLCKHVILVSIKNFVLILNAQKVKDPTMTSANALSIKRLAIAVLSSALSVLGTDL